MPAQPFTIIDDARPIEVAANVENGRVWLPAEWVRAAVGWDLQPQGLCRGDFCVPPPPGVSISLDGIDVVDLAAVLRRPLALDVQEGGAYLGAPAHERGAALASLQAPDFTLPDLHGRLHRLSDQRGKKVLLVIYASW